MSQHFFGSWHVLIMPIRTFSTPQHLTGASFEDQLNALEDFWDSEVPRIGEPGALGWAAWEASNRADQPPPTTKGTEDDIRIPDAYAKWAASETAADRAHALSLRSTDDDESADPYAVVLFSDIRPHLFPLRTQPAKDTFRRIWLAFVGLHVPGFVASLSDLYEDKEESLLCRAGLVVRSSGGISGP